MPLSNKLTNKFSLLEQPFHYPDPALKCDDTYITFIDKPSQHLRNLSLTDSPVVTRTCSIWAHDVIGVRL